MVRDVLEELFSKALLALGVQNERAEFEVPREEGRGDYATNIAMVIANRLKKNPHDVATELLGHVKTIDGANGLTCIASAEVAGPGFINVTLSDELLAWEVQSALEYRERYGSSVIGAGKTVVIDYFQPNIAKPLHIGHLRSAVIGDCLKRVLKFSGYDVVADSHVGDWGFQFGLLLWAFKKRGDRTTIEANPIDELLALYVWANREMEGNERVRDEAKAEFKKIEEGDPENTEFWKWAVEVSMNQLRDVRALFDLLPFEEDLGESYYQDRLMGDLAFLKGKGMVTTGDDGEQYVDLEHEKLGRFILVNSAGITMYALRDVSTFLHRLERWKFDQNIYVVDARQGFYFRQFFAAMKKAGMTEIDRCVHVSFGSMSSPEGAFSTRKGTHIKLLDVYRELEHKALEVIEKKNPSLDRKDEVARSVALAALKFGDLIHDRQTDIVFRMDEVLDFEGKTGPYIQYTYARIWSILRKASYDPFEARDTALIGRMSSELRDIAVIIARFPSIVLQVAECKKPNLLADHVFLLAQKLNTFYAKYPVLKESDDGVRKMRLLVLASGAQVLENGLRLLGITAPREM